MGVALFTHPSSLAHEVPFGHPERPERVGAILTGLEGEAFSCLRRISSPAVEEGAVLRAHSPAHLAALRDAAPEAGVTGIDADTCLSPGSWSAALHAAGAVVAAIDGVLAGEYRSAFCVHRPPGHHACSGRAMGFCLVNHVAIGALHALSHHGLGKVAIVDFDVHHGNGTQEIFWRDSRVLFLSSHQMPLYPGSGREDERGISGNIVNAVLAPGDGGSAFRALWRHRLLPALESFAPELILASAGFDAHRADPIAEIMLEEADYFWLTESLCTLARRIGTRGGIVSSLEGGYELHALARAAAVHVRALIADDGI